MQEQRVYLTSITRPAPAPQLRDPYAGLPAADALTLASILRRVALDEPEVAGSNSGVPPSPRRVPLRRRVVAVSCSDAGSEGAWAALDSDDVVTVCHAHGPPAAPGAGGLLLVLPRTRPAPQPPAAEAGSTVPAAPAPPGPPAHSSLVSLPHPPLPQALRALARSRSLSRRLHDAFDWLLEPLALVVCRRPLPGPSPRSPRLLGAPFLLLRMFAASIASPRDVLARFVVSSLALAIFMGVLFSGGSMMGGESIFSR